MITLNFSIWNSVRQWRSFESMFFVVIFSQVVGGWGSLYFEGKTFFTHPVFTPTLSIHRDIEVAAGDSLSYLRVYAMQSPQYVVRSWRMSVVCAKYTSKPTASAIHPHSCGCYCCLEPYQLNGYLRVRWNMPAVTTLAITNGKQGSIAFLSKPNRNVGCKTNHDFNPTVQSLEIKKNFAETEWSHSEAVFFDRLRQYVYLFTWWLVLPWIRSRTDTSHPYGSVWDYSSPHVGACESTMLDVWNNFGEKQPSLLTGRADVNSEASSVLYIKI